MSTTLQARPVPDIVTELPGPKARAHIEFDHAWTSPSLPRAYPIVPVRGLGCAIEDIDGNVFLDFAAGIAVNSTGHATRRRRGHRGAGRRAQPLQRVRLLPAHLRPGGRGLARIAPMTGPTAPSSATRAPRPSRPASSSPAIHTRRPNVIAFLGAFHGRTMGAVSLTASKAKYHAHFGPMLPGRLPRAVRQRGPRRDRAAGLQAPDAGRRVRGHHRRADPGRGRLRRPRRRLPPAPARASATATASSSSPTRSSRAPGAPGRCGRSSTGASSPTSS